METRAGDLSDWLLAHGRTSITTTEAAHVLGIPAEQVRVRLHRQVQTQRLFSPARGLWVPVPPEYRSWGVTPVTHFLHDLMTHLGRTYYLGWLSAAELHGASHQRAQVSQVAVHRPTEDRDIGRARLRFHTRTHLTGPTGPGEANDASGVARPGTPPPASAAAVTASVGVSAGGLGAGAGVVAHPVPTGTVFISRPELTALDLCEHPARGGGLSNVATVLGELIEEAGLDAEFLTALAPTAATAASRRLGYLLTLLSEQDLLGSDVDVAPVLERLHEHLHTPQSAHPLTQKRAQRAPQTALLDSRGPRRGARDRTWGLILNTDVEPDL